MRLRPTEHLENCWPKCKMHTQERLFCILQLIYKENRTRSFSQNRTETEPNSKNPFRTFLVKADSNSVVALWNTWHLGGLNIVDNDKSIQTLIICHNTRRVSRHLTLSWHLRQSQRHQRQHTHITVHFSRWPSVAPSGFDRKANARCGHSHFW